MTKMRWWVVTVLALLVFSFGALPTQALEIDKDTLAAQLTAQEIMFPFPEDFERWPEPERPTGANTASTGDARGHMVGGTKVIYYRTSVWGAVAANFEDFRAKVAETLNDARGWARAGLKFVEVKNGYDVDIILSDPAHLGATPGCSADLSCTTWANQVIINDIRWREGTGASRAGGMNTRDYQHMVINHEMGHWLGHYAHIDGCTAENGFIGGPAPIMLQQSTGLRGCTSFNAWPLNAELWTLR